MPRVASWLPPLLLLAQANCATIEGSAADPGDDDAVLASLKPYFMPDADAAYFEKTSDSDREAYRNKIVLLRMRAYDIEFGRFERQLWGSGNLAGAGSDLAVLVLAGIGATTGNLATKTAMAAASAGIVGAQGAISKDIYFQRTLPALLSQMEAYRATARLPIVNGLKLPDAQYTLPRAELDPEALSRASAIAGAVSDITRQASEQNASARKLLTEAQFGLAPVAADQQDRRVAISNAIRANVGDRAKLDQIAAAAGVSATPGEAAKKERNDILDTV